MFLAPSPSPPSGGAYHAAMSPRRAQASEPQDRRKTPLSTAIQAVLDASPFDTDEDAARAAGIHPSTLSKWLNDQQRPSWPKLISVLPKWHSSLAYFESALVLARDGTTGPYQRALDEKGQAERRIRELEEEAGQRAQHKAAGPGAPQRNRR